MALKSFIYAFEELPLVTSNGFEACDVTGIAEIAYDGRGAWNVERIGFEGVRWGTATPGLRDPSGSREQRTIWLDVGDPIQMLVYDRLEHAWRARVQRQVDERVCDDRSDDASLTDHLIALRKEWS
jgi:hypothetical protein